MAKFFPLSTALILAVASARNADFPRENDKALPMGNGNFGGRQGLNGFDQPTARPSFGEFGGQDNFQFPENKGDFSTYPEGLPENQGGFPGQQRGFPEQQRGFPTQKEGFPGQRGGVPGQQGGFPGQQRGYPGNQGGFPRGHGGFPGHYGHGGHGPHLPPFLSNVTKEALNELHNIIKNEDLTKAELEMAMDNWAKEQGEDIEQNFAEMREERKQKEKTVTEITRELLTIVAEILTKTEEIKSNMEITRMEEKKQTTELLMGVPPAAAHLFHMLEKEAKKIMAQHEEGPEPPEAPEGARVGNFPAPQGKF